MYDEEVLIVVPSNRAGRRRENLAVEERGADVTCGDEGAHFEVVSSGRHS